MNKSKESSELIILNLINNIKIEIKILINL